MTIAIKKELYRMCMEFVQQRMAHARQALQSAEESAGEETKSSAGDKYETGREMMQQEKNRNLMQLNEANKLMITLQSINPATQTGHVQPGSLVVTDKGNFYMAVSAGSLSFDGIEYFAVSKASPVGLKLTGCCAGDEFDVNGKHYCVQRVI